MILLLLEGVMQNGLIGVLLSTIFLFPVQNVQDPIAGQEHIRQVVLSLSPDSEMRRDLERGDRGDGVRYAWMGQMKESGVRRAKVFLDFKWNSWKKHPVDV